MVAAAVLESAGEECAEGKSVATQVGEVEVVMTAEGKEEAENEGNGCYEDGDSAEAEERASPGDGGPEQVELLLDGERPEGGGEIDVEDGREVGEEECGKGDIGAGVRDEDEDQEENDEVEGQDAENSLPVEVPVVGWGVAVFDEERGDEESGEDEEDVHAETAEDEDGAQGSLKRGPLAGAAEQGDVMEEDEQDGDAPHAVEFGETGHRF